jgi:DNA helicase-2/ATP-dependent DNA helicase PcrA
MKKLSLSCARCRFRNGEQQFNRPSRFITEIPRYLLHSGSSATPPAFGTAKSPARQPGSYSAAQFLTGQPGTGTWNPAKERRTKQAARPQGKSGLDLLAGNPMISKGFGSAYKTNKKEQDPAKITYTEGDRVSHARFGAGVVTELSPSGSDFEVTVAFDNGNTRKMLASFAKLKKC